MCRHGRGLAVVADEGVHDERAAPVTVQLEDHVDVRLGQAGVGLQADGLVEDVAFGLQAVADAEEGLVVGLDDLGAAAALVGDLGVGLLRGVVVGPLRTDLGMTCGNVVDDEEVPDVIRAHDTILLRSRQHVPDDGVAIFDAHRQIGRQWLVSIE